MEIHSLVAGIANTFLLDEGRGVVVIDAGIPHQARRILSRVRALGRSPREVRLIIVTHGHIDHAGSAAALRRLTGAPIAMHRADAPLVATPQLQVPPGRDAATDALARLLRRLGWLVPLETFSPDVWLEEGQSLREFGVAGRVVHTPGHTDGSISVALDDGALFVGDAILNLARVSFPLFWQDPATARASALKIQALQPRCVYPAHGRAFTPAQLDAFIARVARNGGSPRR